MKLCKSRPSSGVWGHTPRNILKKKNSCPEIDSGGFWQLADYPMLCVQNHSILINTCKCILEQDFKDL